jgi:predicted ATPase
MPSNRLDYITIRGFKSIASVEKLKLGAINVLIGANGTGKSNFLQAFEFLRLIRDGRLRQYTALAGGAERVLHFGSKTTKEIYIHLSFEDETNQYEITLAPAAGDTLFPSAERCLFWDKKTHPERPFAAPLPSPDSGGEVGISQERLTGVAGWVRNRLGSLRVYHFHDTSFSSPMRKTARVNDNKYLRPDGSNLASFLYLLHQRYPASYELIRQTVRQAAPFFADFQLEPLRLEPDTIQLEWRHEGSDRYFDASSFSDGTLRFIALSTLFLQPEEFLPSAILVDEPELGLHPHAIELLASLIRHASQKVQVVASTQSSLLIDHFAPEDVLVAERTKGGTQIARLDPARLAAWLEDYSLGQLWEKNEFGGRPVPE